MPTNLTRPTPSWRILTWLMTAFLAILVPVYLHRYGATNFLYFCDLALFLTAVSLWSRWSLPASVALVGILLPQVLWTLDLIARLCGVHLIGMTDYLFDSSLPLLVRGLSLFHLWLPWLLWWMVRQVGYDRRALGLCVVGGGAILLICWLVLPPPPAPAGQPHLPVNVNLVFGLDDAGPQTWMPATAWFLGLFLGLPLLA